MSSIGSAIREIQTLDTLAKEDRWINHLHPSVKLFLTLLYIVLVVSFHKYDLFGLLGMVAYPLIIFIAGELSFKDALRRLRIVLPLVMVVGIFNPLFDTQPMMHLGSLTLSGGVVSMLTLMLKGVLTVLASYLLIATTPIEGICLAMRRAHVPQIFVIEILLIYRYISVLLGEARRTVQAYSLRAPGSKGVAFKAWGSLLGQLLLRAMDRAGELYESMSLRGFKGEFYFAGQRKASAGDYVYLAVWTAVFVLLRLFPVASIIGGLFL